MALGEEEEAEEEEEEGEEGEDDEEGEDKGEEELGFARAREETLARGSCCCYCYCYCAATCAPTGATGAPTVVAAGSREQRAARGAHQIKTNTMTAARHRR